MWVHFYLLELYFYVLLFCFRTGIVVGVGAAMVRDSAAVMLGHYFKRRRQFVEMITMSGEGVGVALFSVILKEGVGWVPFFPSFSFFVHVNLLAYHVLQICFILHFLCCAIKTKTQNNNKKHKTKIQLNKSHIKP